MSKKIKVMYLSTMYQNFIHDQIIKLIKSGQVDALACFAISYYDWLRNKNIRQKVSGKFLQNQVPKQYLKKFFFPTFPKNFMQQYYTNFIFNKLKNLNKKHKFDIIHAHALHMPGVVANMLSKKWKIPFVVTSHGVDFYRCLSNVNTYRQVTQYPAKTLTQVNDVLKNASSVIAVSNNFKGDILSYYSKAKVDVIENSYNHKLFVPADKNLSKKQLGLSGKIVLSVGNFVKTKGHIYLIKAFANVLKTINNAKLILIGGGNLKQSYLDTAKSLKIENRLIILDTINHKKLPVYYNAADVFAFPSLSESFGVALIEAMACKTPVITSMAAGPKSIVTNKVDGLLTEANNINKLSNHIISLLTNKNLANTLATNAHKLVTKKYTSKEDEILNLYKKILGKI